MPNQTAQYYRDRRIPSVFICELQVEEFMSSICAAPVSPATFQPMASKTGGNHGVRNILFHSKSKILFSA